jgi:hypothetical protein
MAKKSLLNLVKKFKEDFSENKIPFKKIEFICEDKEFLLNQMKEIEEEFTTKTLGIKYVNCSYDVLYDVDSDSEMYRLNVKFDCAKSDGFGGFKSAYDSTNFKGIKMKF